MGYKHGWINLKELQRRYNTSDLANDIEYVYLNYYMGQSSKDIEIYDNTLKSCNCWEFTFIKRWGDCPSGCIHSSSQTCTVTMNKTQNSVQKIQCNASSNTLHPTLSI